MSVSPYIAHTDMVEALVFSRDDPFVRHVIVEQGHRRVRIDPITEFEPEAGQNTDTVSTITIELAANRILVERAVMRRKAKESINKPLWRFA